jgi:hypothetical protein
MEDASPFEFVPPEILGRLAGLKAYTLVIYRRGPAYDGPEAKRVLQAEHLPYIFGLRDNGDLLITMPVQTEGEVVAIGIFLSTEEDDVRPLIMGDPAVAKCLFLPEILLCLGLQGDALT